MKPISEDAITLPTEIDRADIAELRPRLERLLSGSSLRLDGSQIRHVHTPGVQLLCALVLAAEGRGVGVVWTSVPPMLVTYVRLLGIGDVMRFHTQVPEPLDRFE